jgi:hypothetical protein
MMIEIRDELVWELRQAMVETERAVGQMPRKRAEKRLGAAVDGLVREMVGIVQKLGEKKEEKT